MNKGFQDLLDALEGKYQALPTMAPTIAKDVPSETPVGGVSLFSENSTHFFEVPHGALAGPAQAAIGRVLHPGHVDRREIPAAHQPGQRHRIGAVGLDPVPWLSRDQRRGDHMTGQALPGQGRYSQYPHGPAS